jgi:hypothetical protein
MSATPINSANAIDAAAFVVIFNRLFNEKEENKLLALKEIFKDELPDFSRTTKVTIKHEKDKPLERVEKESGVKLQKYEPSGKIGWAVNVIENQIVVTCQSYDRWKNVWEQADKYIQAALKQLDLNSLSVQACVLQFVDRFTERSTSVYDVYEVFDKKTAYLTSKANSAGELWHVHQGWFDEKSTDEKILNVLNLGTNKDNGKIITTIDHSLQLQFLNPKAAKKFFDTKKEYANAFLFLHESNKDVIKSLLNQKQRKALVGLV